MPSRRQRWIVIAVVLVILTAALADRWARVRGAAAADADAAGLARTHVGLLESELQKFRLLPLVLAEYPDVADALAGDVAARDPLNNTLELLARRTNAANIYAIDASGQTVASSNWRLPTSFVGKNYNFRPYFHDAMIAGRAELFALGTTSRRPGLYLALRVERNGRHLGVVVVKVEFDAIETAWGRAPGASFVVDSRGGILVTSVPDWRFRTLGPPDPRLVADTRRTLQFGTGAPRAAPIELKGQTAVATLGGLTMRYRLASVPAPIAGARLYHLTPLDPAQAAARLVAAVWALLALIALGVGAALAIRGRYTRRLQREAQAMLEAEVQARTAELREESEERLASDRRYRAAREELAQANRLGTLGQITAGVAHEINQPVAAIRAYAENGVRFLDRGDATDARGNLDRIVALADRIGRITGELRTFARRRTPAGGPVNVGAAIDGTMLILGERARGIVTVEAPAPVRRIAVSGDRVRIEQILVNLLQNALDAVAEQADGHVTLRAGRSGDRVRLSVIDNGPGVAPAIVDQLFTPFATAKPDGLGLGLAIALDIAREMGGDLVHRPGALATHFELELRVAS